MSFTAQLIEVTVPVTISGVTTTVTLQYAAPPEGGGGGSSTFVGLTDTPASYEGHGGKVLAVKAAEDGVEFVDPFVTAADLEGHEEETEGVHGISAFGATLVSAEDAEAARTVLGAAAAGSGGGEAPAWGDLTGTLGDQTDLQAALDGKADDEHTHPVSDIDATGTADSTTFLRGDGSWATPEVVAAAWGSVTGTLEDQTDLQDALDGKANISHNHSASDITSGTLAVNRGGTGSTGFITPSNYTPGGATVAFHLGGIDTALGNRPTSSAVSSAISSAIGGLAAVAASGDWADLTGTPTTLAGYGITDAAPADLALAELRCTFDGGGSVLEDTTVTTVIARACVLTAAYLVADAAGDVTVTVKRDRGGTETTLGTLTLTAEDGSSLTDLSGWAATDLAAGDRLTAEAADAATITHLGLILGRRAG